MPKKVEMTGTLGLYSNTARRPNEVTRDRRDTERGGVQAVLNVYAEFHRADSHVVWAHMDQWEGQQFNTAPGNLINEPQKVHLDPGSGYNVKISLTRLIPPIEMPADTEWVKRIKFQSKTLTQFWGHPIYIGATVLVPKGYDAHPGVHYPVIYLQGHFSLDGPFGFTTEPDKPGTKSWARQREEWGALAMQLYHPDFFGGTWSFYPDPVDFRRYYGGVDLYKDDNAFTEKPGRVFAGAGRAIGGSASSSRF
jgi:hypothetical protein